MDDWDAGLAAIIDPDYLLDTFRDSLHDDPVPCAICGGEGAFYVVTLAPEHIFHGPIAPQRGICAACKDARYLEHRMTNRGAA